MSKEMICVPAEIYVEHTCDLADQIMQDRLNRSYEDYLLGNDDIGYSYTDEGQDIFNDILDEVESFLAKFNVVNEIIIRRTKMSKVFREWFDTVDKNRQEWLDFVKQQEQDDEMSAQILEDMNAKNRKRYMAFQS